MFLVFVGVTMDAGFCLAPVPFDQLTFLLTTTGTLLCSASANTLNQVQRFICFYKVLIVFCGMYLFSDLH